MATPAKKAKTPVLPACPYGARCYRKNPQHLAEFSHLKPEDDGNGKDEPDSAAPPRKIARRKPLPSLPSVDDSDLPPCRFGAKCYRKNLLHFAEFSHPTTVISTVCGDPDSGSDTDEIADEDEKSSSSKTVSKLVKNATDDDGMSLMKSFTAMSEAERKELIKKAFAAKKKLEQELLETKQEMKKKDEKLDNMQKQINTGMLLMEGKKEVLEGKKTVYFDLFAERAYKEVCLEKMGINTGMLLMEGEKEALEGKKTVYFDLFAERAYKEGSAAQTHFRLAESQFYRLLSGSNYRITKVQYVLNPELYKGFKNAREELKKTRGEKFSYPVLGFHGTTEKNINPICETGFKIPGQDKNHKHRTDTGWYGKGVYFSEYPDYSMGYIQGATKLMLCQVLPGKVYDCKKLIHGAALQAGSDSHTSPDKKELVIFNKYHILPAYIVHYTAAAKGEFKYKDAKSIKGNPFPFDMNLFDNGVLTDKYHKCCVKKKSQLLEEIAIQFTGNFCGTQKEMMNLATKQGARMGTKAVFSLLVAARDEFDLKTSKVLTAENKGVPVVPEMYLYDCILKGKVLSKDKYAF